MFWTLNESILKMNTVSLTYSVKDLYLAVIEEYNVNFKKIETIQTF